MKTKQVGAFGSVVFLVLVIMIGRLITQTNPVYDVLEPVIAWVDKRVTANLSFAGDTQSNDLASSNAQLEQLRDENLQLRDQLGLSREQRIVQAEVLRRDLLGFRRLVTIDVGKQQGIAAGQTVLSGDNLFGVVDEVFDQSAVVRTVLDPDFRATVNVGEEQAVLRIKHGYLVADLVPGRNLVDQPIVTNSLGGEAIADVFVGETGQQVGNAGEVFGTYTVLLPYSVFDVRFADVVIGEGR